MEGKTAGSSLMTANSQTMAKSVHLDSLLEARALKFSLNLMLTWPNLPFFSESISNVSF